MPPGRGSRFPRAQSPPSARPHEEATAAGERAETVIGPITPLIDKVHEWTGQSPHPAVVALPLVSWSFSNGCGTPLEVGSRQ